MLLFTFPTEGITEVVLGCNMSAKDREALMQVLDAKLTHVAIFNASTNLEHFRLEINAIARIKQC